MLLINNIINAATTTKLMCKTSRFRYNEIIAHKKLFYNNVQSNQYYLSFLFRVVMGVAEAVKWQLIQLMKVMFRSITPADDIVRKIR